MKYPIYETNSYLPNIELYEGESIEQRVRKMTESGEPINDTQPLIYTEKKDGIISAYDIRRDKWDEAIETTDIVTGKQRNSAKKEIAPKPEDFGNVPNKTDGGSPSDN